MFNTFLGKNTTIDTTISNGTNIKRSATQFHFLATIAFAVIFFAFSAHSAAAEVTRTYDGCFERTGDADSALIYIKAPVCTITLTNTLATAGMYDFTVINLDPDFYNITDENGNIITANRETATLSFSTSFETAETAQTHTITIAPWDYDPTSTDFWFSAVSDSQSQAGGDIPNPIFLDVLEDLDLIRPRFMTNSGDVIGGSATDAGRHQAEYEAYDEELQQFEGSMFSVPGDHDTNQNLDTYYSAFFGSRDYTFVYGNTLFIGLSDTETLETEGRLSEDQFTWLEQMLAANTSEHTIVMMQHPLVPPSWASSSGIDSDLRLRLAGLFTQYGVELTLVGDAHGYDYSLIDATNVPGLEGSYYQLDCAGAGGKYTNYTGGDHYFTLVHVSDSGITHYKYDYSTFDLSVDYETANDGTTDEVRAIIVNNNAYDMPYVRVKAIVNASENAYAITSDGQYLPLVSTEINGVRYGYVEISVAAAQTLSITFKDQRTLLTNASNSVNTDGVITFDTPPDATAFDTGVSIVSAESASDMIVTNWDPAQEKRAWTESTTAGSSTTFSVAQLSPNRQYNIFVDGTLEDRVTADESGVVSFTYESASTSRSYSVSLEHEIIATNIGALPSGKGAPNFRLYGSSGDLKTSFYAGDSSISTGFDSVWADVDGDLDSALEIATVPIAGAAANVRVYTKSGTRLASVYPFGETFTDGVHIASGDIDGDGADEIIVAPKGNHKAIIKIYHYDAESGSLQLLDGARVFPSEYRNGVNIAIGDLNGDEDAEVIVTARDQKQVVKVYHWKPKKGEMHKWLGKRVETASESGGGFTVAAGDIDFDNRDEIIIGSAHHGSMVHLLKYVSSKSRMNIADSYQAFDDGFTGGVHITSGNIHKSVGPAEIIVTQTGGADVGASGAVRVLAVDNATMESLDLFRPFGASYTDTLWVALADADNDGKLEIATSRESGNDRIRVYEKRKTGVARIASYTVYDTAFAGGVHLTQ